MHHADARGEKVVDVELFDDQIVECAEERGEAGTAETVAGHDGDADRLGRQGGDRICYRENVCMRVHDSTFIGKQQHGIPCVIIRAL